MLSCRERIVARPRSLAEARLAPGTVEDPDLHIPLAYIDPGSGSLIIQAVIAGAVAAPIVLRNQLRRAGSAIRRAVGGTRAERTKE
jgi:hypothetical protein